MRFLLLLLFSLLLPPCAFAQTDQEIKLMNELADSHIDGNVPDKKDFRPFLIRDLISYFKPTSGDSFSVDYELLRDGPTQTGVSYPKFYLWVTVTKPDKTIVDGAVRVAAIDKKEFQITTFISRIDILAHPESLDSVFPKLLLEKIKLKAGVKK